MARGSPAEREAGPRWRRAGVLGVVVAAAVAALAGVVLAGFGNGEESEGKPLATGSGQWELHRNLDAAISVAPAPDGGLWVGTASAGLLRWSADGEDYQQHTPWGLAGFAVHHVAVAEDGTVWAATRRPGLGEDDRPAIVRFDGQEWTTFRAASGEGAGGEGPPSTRVASLTVDDAGDVWVGTYQGLARFDGDRWVRYTREDHGLDAGPVEVVTVGRGGAVWVGASDGVARFDGQRWTRWIVGEQLPGAQVAGLATGADGSVWIATQGAPDAPAETARERLLRLSDDGWTLETEASELPGGPHGRSTEIGLPLSFEALVVDADGAVWLPAQQEPAHKGAIPGTVAARFDGESWTTHHPHPDQPGPLSLTGGDGGEVWALTHHGPHRFEEPGWTRYATGRGPPTDTMRSAVIDEHDQVWVASHPQGVLRFDGQQWDGWHASDGVAHDWANDVARTDDGTVWAATHGGVSRFDGTEWTSWTADDGLPANKTTAVAIRDGTVWAATEDGVARYDGQQWSPIASDVDPSPEVVTGLMAVGPDNAVWLGTERGVARFDGQQWTRWTAYDGLPSAHVRALTVADDGTAWAGTNDGLARFDGQDWTDAASTAAPWRVNEQHPLAHDWVSGVAVDDGGGVWAATRDRLYGFDGHTWTAAADNPSLAAVESVTVTDDTVWLATQVGLAEFIR